MCFIAHKLIIKIDEDVHLYHENNEIRQTLIENLGFTFIKINPDPDPDAGFNLDVEIVKHSGPLEWIKYFIEKVRPTL